MKKIMFSDKFLLTKAVLDGRKTQTRRLLTLTLHKKADRGNALIEVSPSKVFFEDGKWKFVYDDYVFLLPKENYPKYRVGEVIAVAQSYRDCGGVNEYGVPMWEIISQRVGGTNAGWDNKMFVRGDLMPHQIRITGVRPQRLQNISDEDCLAEGIIKNATRYCFKQKVKQTTGDVLTFSVNFDTPREAYAALIDKISGKGTWDSNPWVWAYTFELVK